MKKIWLLLLISGLSGCADIVNSSFNSSNSNPIISTNNSSVNNTVDSTTTASSIDATVSLPNSIVDSTIESTIISSTSTSTSIKDTCGGSYLDVTIVNWGGITDNEVKLGKQFDLKAGVSATYSIYGMQIIPTLMPYIDITVDKGEVSDTGKLKTHMLEVGDIITATYTVERNRFMQEKCAKIQDDNVFIQTRKITITAAPEQMVMNGDIEQELRTDGSLPGWNNYLAKGGSADCGVWGVGEEGGNHYLYLDVTKLSVNSYEPRLNTDEYDFDAGILLQKAKMYQVTFKAKANKERSIHLQVAELLGSIDPYIYQYSEKTFDLTPQWRDYKYTFVMESETTVMGHLIFNCGTVNSAWVAGKVYLDDVDVKEFKGEELPKEAAPTFEGVGFAWRRVTASGTFDVAAGVKAFDVDGKEITNNITTSITKSDDTSVASIPLNQVGTYYVTYYVVDEYENWALSKRRIDIISAGDLEPNLFGTPTDGIEAGTQEGAYVNPGKFLMWTDPGNAESGATITFDNSKPSDFKDGVLSITYKTTTTDAHSYAVQLFYKSPEVSNSGVYTVSFKLVSEHATQMQINGKNVAISIGENNISYNVLGNGITLAVQFGAPYEDMKMCPSGTYIFKDFKMA